MDNLIVLFEVVMCAIAGALIGYIIVSIHEIKTELKRIAADNTKNRTADKEEQT